jgi:hypothetical protein
MITKTSLRNQIFCQKIKEAIVEAVRNAQTAPGGVYLVDVFNIKNDVSLTIVGSKGRKFKALDRQAKDVTDIVTEALKQFHNKKGIN